MRVWPALYVDTPHRSVPGAWSDLTSSSSSQLLERHFRGMKTVTICITSLGREKTDVKKYNLIKTAEAKSVQSRMSEKESLWNVFAEKKVSLQTGKVNCGHSPSQRSDHWEQLASIPLSPRGHIPENMGQSPGYSPWHSHACWGYGSTAFRRWREPETTTITVKRLLWQQQDCQKSARAGVRHRWSPACTCFLMKGLRQVQRHLKRVGNPSFERQRRASSSTLSTH